MQGIEETLPWLLERMGDARLRGIFFLSTAYLERYVDMAKQIQAQGHLLGSHGDVHRNWKTSRWYEWRLDYLHSMTKIEKTFNLQRKQIPYRAPKFSHVDINHRYSNPQGHLSLMKHVWFGIPWQGTEIMYCHPFDFVEHPKTLPPNLFCRFWYRKGTEAKLTLLTMLERGLLCSVS